MSKSLTLLQKINDEILNNQTFHHHYHILYDLADQLNVQFKYLEIGAYAGGSACLMVSHPNCIQVASVDIGHPVSPEIAINNVKKCNTSCKYDYIQGNSQSYEMLDCVKELIGTVDILFIDGDHSHQGVVNDFLLYRSLVNKNGYIVFDDYMDSKYSPEVKVAVDLLMVEYGDDYNIIGTKPNTAGARPTELTMSNEFIIQRK